MQKRPALIVVVEDDASMRQAIERLLGAGGFRIAHMDSMYLPGTPRFTGYNVWGIAQKV